MLGSAVNKKQCDQQGRFVRFIEERGNFCEVIGDKHASVKPEYYFSPLLAKFFYLALL